jgi:hypothetical protein
MAMVNKPAGSGFWKITSPSGNQASGDTGRKIWMMGSKLFWNSFDTPSMRPIGMPKSSASV